MLRADRLRLAVPGRVLVEGLTFEAKPGEIWGVLGANGTGKTTLVHALAGLAAPASGSVEIENRDVAGMAAHERAALLGVLLQQEDVEFWGDALDYVLLGRYPHKARSSWLDWSPQDRELARAALVAVGMEAGAARSYATLSGGERQRVRLAQVLAQAPRVFLLDEPLQHLDLRYQAQTLAVFRALAERERRAVVMVLHDAVWAAGSCTHALVLYEGGRSDAGPAGEILTRVRLEEAYGCPLTELARGSGRAFVPEV
jgi:iron complex transport system ATP-binding protein